MGKRIAAAVTLAILAATYGLILVYFSPGGKQTPRAENGFLDLTEWRFADDGAVPLDGEWEFYPDKLLSPEDFASFSMYESELTPERIEVPGTWSNRMKALGMATYRLQVKVGDTIPVYGLKTSSIQMSNRIIVNGQVVGNSGNPAEGRNYEAVNRPYVGYFTLKPGWNEIIVQVANYEFPASSGINESIDLGYAKQISGIRDKALAHDWITVTAFLIIGLYFIGLYSQRKDDTSLIVFGLMSVFIALYTSTRGERVLFGVFGNIPFWLYLRIQMVSALGVGMGFLLYVYTAFRPFCSRWLIRIGLIAGAILTLWAVVLIPWLATDLFRQLVTIYATFPLLYAIYIFVLAAFHKVEGSLYLAVAAIALNVYALVQNLNVYFAVPVDSVPPFEPFLFLLMMALLMSLRFSNAFRKIEELTVQLLRADKLKDEFLARTSHEFKSPLHGIMHISRSMLDNANHPPTPEQREKLQLITSMTGNLSQLVYDILDFSKLKQGELAVDPRPVDVRSAVEMQVRIYSFLCADRNIQLENRVPEHLPYALADESRFGQIVGNLLDNAVKHTENGSIVVTAAENRGMIAVSVQDTGEGIEEQNIPHIFEAFQSFDASAESRGFGLGLSIVKQLVELQHGTISVSSTKGAGTIFTFTLPIADRDGKPETSSRALETPIVKAPEYALKTPYYLNQQGKHTVLIVDDQVLNLKVLMDALEPLGYNIIAVKNGYEALEQIGKPNQIDLVVLDLMMPVLSGYEVCQEIRKTYTLPELPVLMVTAAIGPQDKVAAFEAGANDFLPKPFDVAELKARIGSLLAMKESLDKAVDLEVAFLQSQIKPHFLFNSLNAILSFCRTDSKRAEQLITHLSSYLRRSFDPKPNVFVELQDEMQLVHAYVEIEKARFEDRLAVHFEIDENAIHSKLPSLIIQPLVENAIRHGIMKKEDGGTVRLTVKSNGDGIHVIVWDNGIGIPQDRLRLLLTGTHHHERGVGLMNIHRRLTHFYGEGLAVHSKEGEWTKVEFRTKSPIPASF